MAGLQAFGKATEAEQAREAAQQKLDIDRQRIEIERARAIAAASPDKTTLEKNLLAAGYKPGTQEYEQAVRAYLAKSTAPTVTVDMGAGSNEFKKASIEYAFKRIGNEDKAIASMSVLENELDTIQNLIEGGADTGRIAEALIPIQQILAEAGLIGDEEMDDLADRELLQRSISRIIPNMRVEGSGSTSDYEMATFQKAAPVLQERLKATEKLPPGCFRAFATLKNAAG